MNLLRWGWLLLLLAPITAAAAEPATVEVFTPATDGFASIRIPAIVTTRNDTLLAFAEGRAANADQARNKLVLKRSRDGGRTWSKLAVVADDGDRSLNNPCVVVERATGRVLLLYQSYPAGVVERSGRIQPGLDGDLIVRNLLISSDDDGVTWSAPRDVTRQTKRPERVTTVAGGPGLGIQLRHGPNAGRILFPMNEGPFGAWNIYAVYSDDQGETWRMGANAPAAQVDDPRGKPSSQVNEAQFVELSDGSIRFNVRRWAGKAVRKTCVSRDGGLSWSKVEDAPELIDPGCMASVYRWPGAAPSTTGLLLFSGPQSTKRENGVVFLSRDDGATWPTRRVLCAGSFGYSCLTSLADGAIGCLYEAEGAKQIVFARFTLDWLMGGNDHPDGIPR